MDIILRKIMPENKYILDIPELRAMREFRRYEGAECVAAVCKYFEWFCKYCDDIFKGNTYEEDILIREVYKYKKIKSEVQFVNVIHKHLYLCKEYVKFLLSSIKEENIKLYEHTIWRLDRDIESLILIRESRRQVIKQEDLKMTCGVKDTLSTRDLFGASRELFHIEDINDINKMYLMDLKPIVTFQIRQIIELYGKRMLGLWAIVHHNDGTVAKQFTQIAWKFLKDRNDKSDKWKIELPFDLDNILALNDWANGYTHSANIDSPYLQFYALEVLCALFKATDKPIKTILGNNMSTMYAPIKIYGYDALKRDFENYIQPEKRFLFFWKKKRHDYSVVWLDEKNVDAYIISR